MFNWLKKRRRGKLARQPWPREWDEFLNRHVRQYRIAGNDSAELQGRWRNLIKIVVAEKYWEGCEGLAINDEIKVTIAAQATMLLLGVENFYFDNVRSIIVYPATQVSSMSDGTVVGERHLAGQAWQGGPVILSWADVVAGGRSSSDGRNLVVHEFAHCLDGLDGEMGGNLVFDNKETARRWQEVCSREFQELVEAAENGRSTLLDQYGATNQAEFFAVASETFFERPEQLQQSIPDLFELMVEYYGINPSDLL